MKIGKKTTQNLRITKAHMKLSDSYKKKCVYSNVLKLAPVLEGLLLEVVCKEELKRTITYDFIYISVVLVFFWPTL